MSVKAMSWVFEQSPYTGGARLVHLALADKANDHNDYELWMHQSKIAEMARVSVTSVGRILRQMVADGYLDKIEDGRGRGRSTRYRLVMKSDQNGVFSPDEKRPSAPGKATICATEKTPSAQPVLSSSQEGTQGTQRALATRGARDLTGFDEFWKAYPRRNGRRLGRGKCVERWIRLTLDDRRAAWRGAVHYAHDVDAGLTIAKDPDRWLRDRCWEDWQDPPSAVGSTPGPRGPRGNDPLRGRHTTTLDEEMALAMGATP
ncbi:MAG: hypothetical protein KGH75_00200 [Rhodospirillales bacterium]|nr:hypothetical protein [Rhodospirillales bacterium]